MKEQDERPESFEDQDFCPACCYGGVIEPIRHPDPFETVLNLVSEHGNRVVIEELATHAKYDAEEQDVCLACREEAAWLHVELSQLLARYELLFPEPESVAGVNQLKGQE